MKIPDAHCHVDQLASVGNQRVIPILGPTIAVTNDWMSYLETKALCDGKEEIFVSLGLHPRLVRSHSEDIPLIINGILECRFVGEIGLDSGSGTKQEEIRLQKEVLKGILVACESSRKVINVHSAGAERVIVGMILSYDVGPVILHWYTGPPSLLRIGVDQGWYFSFPPAVCRSKKLQKSLTRIPMENILVESDAPGGLIEPSIQGALRQSTREIARIKRRLPQDVRDQIGRNFEGLVEREIKIRQNQSSLRGYN